MEEWKRLGPSYPAARVRPTTERNEVNKVTQLARRWGIFYAKRFGRREVRRTNIINKDGGPINPKKGDQRVFKDEGQRWDGNKFPLPPRRWRLMLHCRAKGEAAKGLVA
jgi:hypothetical protein